MESALKGDVVNNFQLMSNELGSTKILICPSDTKTSSEKTTSLNRTNISYIIGLNALTTEPQTILSGDANLLVDNEPVKSGLVTIPSGSIVEWSSIRHNKYGNIGFADGSVMTTTCKTLNDCFQSTNPIPTRLAIP